MFVLCVLYSKDKRQSQDNQEKARQTKYRERTKKKTSRPGHGCLSVVSVVCLSGRGLCDEPIPRQEESYRL
jgi:hypothetical protein